MHSSCQLIWPERVAERDDYPVPPCTKQTVHAYVPSAKVARCGAQGPFLSPRHSLSARTRPLMQPRAEEPTSDSHGPIGELVRHDQLKFCRAERRLGGKGSPTWGAIATRPGFLLTSSTRGGRVDAVNSPSKPATSSVYKSSLPHTWCLLRVTMMLHNELFARVTGR